MDITKEVGELLDSVRERFKNPLVYSFVFSWLAWNYKAVVVVLSDGGFAEKIAYLDLFVYPDGKVPSSQVFYYPLLCALFYSLALPFFSVLVTGVSTTVSLLNTRVRVTVGKAIGYSGEQVEKIRSDYEARLLALDNQVTSLKNELSNANGRMAYSIERLFRYVSPPYFEYLRARSGDLVGRGYVPLNQEDATFGTEEQNEFFRSGCVPGVWVVALKVAQHPREISVEDLMERASLSEHDAMGALLGLTSLSLLRPEWRDGRLIFQIVECRATQRMAGRYA